MSPADGASLHLLTQSATPVAVPVAVVLPGGRCLLAVEGPGRPPAGGASVGDAPLAWSAAGWPSAAVPGAWAGLAVLDAVPRQALELDAEGARWALAAPARLDVSPEPVAAFARRHGLAGRGALDFLVARLPAASEDGPAARWRRDFLESFLAAAAEPDGFVEVVGVPDCGGLFAQGWSVSLEPGRAAVARLDGGLSLIAGEVATFPRDDILPPARGFCAFSHDRAAEELGAAGAIFIEQGGRLLRLDVVGGSVPRLAGRDATAHVAGILPRLQGPDAAMRAFRRVCRPRYEGADTLSGTPLPVAAAFDAVFQAPDGGLLAMGWLLDPLHRVERAHVRSTAGLHAPLQDRWHRLPRPDLAQGFAADPRFARLLDDEDALHGVLAYAPGRTHAAEAEAYLELVLDDGSCLFRPLAITRLEDRDRVPAILAAVPPSDPDIDAVVRGTLAPFLAALPPRPPRPRAGAPRPIPLGRPGSARDVAAVMPVRGAAELQPVLALLSGTPDAEGLDLVLVAARSVASGLAERLDEAFRFYGLTGALVLAPEREGLRGRVEAGIAASAGSRVLVWTPRALPRGPGWLGRLVAEAEALERPGLVSPTLVYEDGSIHFGGPAGAPGAAGPDAGGAPFLGYPAGWLPAAGTQPVPCGAAEAMLVDRAALGRAGGFSGGLFGDALAHRDLARRLHAAGCGTWCAGAVEFWMLEDGAGASRGPQERIMDRIDALLVAEPGTEGRR